MYIGKKSRRHYIWWKNIHHRGMSTVFLVKDSEDERAGNFVLKLAKDTNEDTLQLLQREIANHTRLGNFEFHQDGLITFKEEIQPLPDGTRGFVMEWIQEGKTLQSWLQVQKSILSPTNFIPLAWRVLWRLVKLTCALHQRGFLHNDIKPENVSICGNHRDFQIYLLDLGIARHKSESLPVPMGTPNYSAPECMDPTFTKHSPYGLDRGDESSDLYAIVQTWVHSIYPGVQRALTPQDLTSHKMISIIPLKLQRLLIAALQSQENRVYRTSYDFLHALSNCLLFSLPQPIFIDQCRWEHDTDFIEWYTCPLSLLTLPQKSLTKVNGPTLIAQKSGILCHYVRDVDVFVYWSTPANHSQTPTKRITLYSKSILPWKYPQKGAFVDIVPVDSNLPAQRLEYPSKQEAVRVALKLHRHKNQSYLTNLQVSVPKSLDSFSIFVSSKFKPPYQIQHSRGQIASPHPVVQPDALYLVWDRRTLNIVDVIGYEAYSYSMRSCLYDEHVQLNLPTYTAQLTQQALHFQKNDTPLLTEPSMNHLRAMAVKWKYALSNESGEDISAVLTQFQTKLTTTSKEHVGILIKLLYTPAFQSLPKEDWINMLWYCRHYNVRTHSFWVLYFFLEPPSVWTLYSGSARRLSSPFSIEDDIEYIHLNSEDRSSVQHMIGIGTRSPLYTLTLQYENTTQTILLFAGDHLTVGRWSSRTPPHIPLFLSPYMPTETLQINSMGSISTDTDSQVRALITKPNDYLVHIKDGGLYQQCPDCRRIYDIETAVCPQHIHQRLQPITTVSHSIQMERIPEVNGVLCKVSSRGVTTWTALNAFTIGSNTIVYIDNGSLNILSQETTRLELETGTAILEPNIEHALPVNTLSIEINNTVLRLQ